MPPLIKCIHIAAHKAAEEYEKEKAKKCAPILATKSGHSRSKCKGCRQSVGGVWVHIGVHNLKRMPANAGAGIGVHNLQQDRTGYI